MSMGSLQFHSKQWIWDGACYPQLFGLGGIMITVAILGLSTTYFGGIGAPAIPYYFWPDLGTLYRRGKSRKRPVRVYMDGCFDLMHYGHANALRQAKALGDELVVGVVSDEEIVANKGPPVLSMEERLTLVSGLKWVDEVITNAPYEINEKFMNILFNDYKIDYIIHGDDPCLLPDGTDAYALAKKVGRYKQIKRTEGVSSTDIVGRILSLRSTKLENGTVNASSHEQIQNGENTPVGGSVKSHLSNFLPTSRRIVQFSNGKGHPPGSINVQIYSLIKEWTAWDIARRAAFAFFGIFSGTEENPEFIQSVESKLDKDAKIIVACSSGGTMRSSQNLPEGQQSRQKTSLQRLL